MEDYFKPTIVGEEIDPREEAVLMGYGSNVARSTPEGWVRPGGEAMSDEDAQALHEETLSRRQKEWGEESEKFAGKKKPTDSEISFVEQWKDFESDARKEIETEGKKRAEAVVAEMESKFKRDVPDSYWVLHPRELATKNEKLAVAHQHIYDKFVTENMNGVRSAFEKDWQNKEKKEAYEQKLADKREDAAEKQAEKVEAQRIRDEAKKMSANTVISSLEKSLPPNADIGDAYAAYRQYLADGYDEGTALRHTIQYMKGNVQDKVTPKQTQKQPLTPAQAAAELARRRGK